MSKIIFFSAIFLMFFTNLFSQKCNASITKDVDRFTKKVSYKLLYPIQRLTTNKKRLFYMNVFKDEEGTLTLILDVKASDFGCD